MAAALALETMDARETIPVLRHTLLTNDDDGVRWYVAKALAAMGDRTSENLVADVLRDLPWWAWARRGRWQAVAETLENLGQGGA